MPTEELFGAYNFLLEIQGIIGDTKVIIGGFKSVSGMDSETEVIEFKQGNDMVVRKKPGRTTYANIVLERGYTATDDLWQWRKNIEQGKIDRRAGSIIILDQDGETEIGRYNFYEGWPCKWYVPDMDADSSAMAIEKVEIAVELIERA
ncbi:MAG: phage tail protein [Deltaproteobacteria bacterium]|jgi:phage tail-like protein|nr:phage tail protein [Deltaproteobacteria bacterium]MBK9370414.1 phage tail protein [Deltaproteobacteria bacterium]MBK9645291.1 phage tail protein [Deltaproteobacteria bacterium]MCK6513483.1 phage tail protein [Myxococcota bacterium]